MLRLRRIEHQCAALLTAHGVRYMLSTATIATIGAAKSATGRNQDTRLKPDDCHTAISESR